MWKTITKLFTVFLLIAALFGTFDVAADTTSEDSGFSLGIVQGVFADCPCEDGGNGCECLPSKDDEDGDG